MEKLNDNSVVGLRVVVLIVSARGLGKEEGERRGVYMVWRENQSPGGRLRVEVAERKEKDQRRQNRSTDGQHTED